jgi:hypothetical protein
LGLLDVFDEFGSFLFEEAVLEDFDQGFLLVGEEMSDGFYNFGEGCV